MVEKAEDTDAMSLARRISHLIGVQDSSKIFQNILMRHAFFESDKRRPRGKYNVVVKGVLLDDEGLSKDGNMMVNSQKDILRLALLFMHGGASFTILSDDTSTYYFSLFFHLPLQPVKADKGLLAMKIRYKFDNGDGRPEIVLVRATGASERELSKAAVLYSVFDV